MTDDTLTTGQADRAAGVLLAQAAGDALGAPYEFQTTPLPEDTPIRMTGGGTFGWEPGEWTDDTQMSIVILQAAEQALADGTTLLDRLDDIAAGWHAWSRTARDVGNQTRRVLNPHGPTPNAATLRETAFALAASGHRTGGNGSLMRTAPVALAGLGKPDLIAATARALSDLTHPDPDAADACVLQCLAIDHAVRTGELDLHVGLPHLPEDRQAGWEHLLTQAENAPAVEFGKNGWVVHALQAAWSLITRTPVPADNPAAGTHPAQHLRLVLEATCRLPGDTDTVAAIAGALLGARWGSTAVPATWRRLLHGWPGLTGTDLADRGLSLARRRHDEHGWPASDTIDYTRDYTDTFLVPHPADPGVLLGNAGALHPLPEGVDAVVSLCRVGRNQPAGLEARHRVVVRLIDQPHAEANPHLDLVLADTADTIAALRAEGRTVLLHCVAAQSRTPTVAAAYAIRHHGRTPQQALDEVLAALPDAHPNHAFRQALSRMATGDQVPEPAASRHTVEEPGSPGRACDG